MRMNIYKKRKYVLSLLCIVFMCCALLGYAFSSVKNSDALPQVPSSTTVSKRLYDFENYCYNQDALDELGKQILSQQTTSYGSNANFNNLISYAQGTAGRAGKPLVNKSITLKYGRYRYTEQSTSYNDLVWMPVYISTNTRGEAILTLYLAATETYKGTSQQEQSFFTSQGLYSTEYDIGAPSNLYGASHMRSISLGAMKPYATYPGGIYRLKEDPSIISSNCNKFSDFIEGTDFKGAFYDDIASPSEMAWQEHETFADYSSKFVTSGFSTTYANYAWPNEAYGTPKTGSQYYLPGYFDYAQKNRTQYDDWKNDKVWLPSLTEVGDGDLDPNGADTTNGVWGLTLSQRSNQVKSWLRTAKTDAPKTSGGGYQYSTYTMFAVAPDGTIGEADVSENIAIRPAIHLNLSKISGKTVPAVRLPELVTSPYNGDPLGQTIDSIPADQKTWYEEGDMTISFYTDKNCTRVVAPIDAGTYYMQVQLSPSSGKRFYGEDENTLFKTTVFVVEKLKLDVVWTYNEDSTVQKVEIDPSYQFFDRDLIPEVSFFYRNIMNAGEDYYDYPEVMGHYRAYAYIVDEEMYKYNYELGENVRSNQFQVDRRVLPLPEFCYGPSDDISADHRTLVLPYKGKNFVQISNITKNMNITVTASDEEALKSLVDLGLNEDGIQTYMVEDVGRYEFTVALSDREKANAKWASSTEVNTDVTDKRLILSIDKAVVTVSFNGVQSSWDTLTEMPFSLGIVGVQAGDDVNMRVYYQPSRGGNLVDLKPDENGRYTIPKGLNIGEYTLAAAISDGQDCPYVMTSAATQKFTITQANSTFDKDCVSWMYTVGDQKVSLSDLGTGSPSQTVEVDFVDLPYRFTLQVGEAYMQSYFLVRAEYSGDTNVKDAGSYSVTVTISAYDKNVSFEPQSYTIKFKINKVKLDVSGVTWNYSSAYKHTGSECKVLLNNVPSGLTVNYTGNTGTDVGTYNAEATFSVNGEYAKNYEAPDDKLTLSWEISESGTATPPDSYDTTNLKLQYSHGGTAEVTAKWDNEQKKWFDEATGNEFVLSFPYDGSEHKLELIGTVPGLTFGTPANNAYTGAKSYTADFNITTEDGKQLPEFATIDWTIEKAAIDFDNVRWGYIDSDGNEYEIDFDVNPFTFTRDDNGPVNFTVGLINLPAGVVVSYTSICLTKANSTSAPGNSFAEAGDYRTEFNRTISFNDPNYVTVNSIPAFIPSFQYWSIQEREFTPIHYDGSWTKFDNKTHDLIELCGIPRDELPYFRVEIAFLDGGNNLTNYYEGYDGVEYAAYHAGKYIVRFFELRGADETEYFWGSAEIDVGKESLEVTWDTKGSIPVARVTGLYVTEMIGTKYTTESDVEVKIEYIRATDGATFFAEPYVMKEYSSDLQLVMAAGQDQKKKFTYWLYTPTAASHQIEKTDIRFRNAKIEYTGEPITFELLYWDMEFAPYLYYEGDSLTQTSVGTYSIEINFIKYDANTGRGDAYWKGTNGDRSTLKLDFEITSPTKIALEYPKLESYSVSYDGKYHKISIVNLAVLNEYLSYEVTLNGRNFGQQLNFKEAGNYAITFRFLPDSIGYWKDDASNSKKDYTIYFTITDGTTPIPPGPDVPNPPEHTGPKELPLPIISDPTREYTGDEIIFVDNWNEMSQYVEISGNIGWQISQKQVGDYTFYLHIKDEYKDTVLWADGTDTDKIIHFSIIPATVSVDKIGAGEDGKVKGPNGNGADVDFDDFFEYKYFDKDGNEVKPEDLVDGEEYIVTVTLKSDEKTQDEFYKSFVNAEDIKNAITNSSFNFTYDSGEKDNKLLIIITIAEVVVLVFLIIATIIVLLIQRKLYDTDDDVYDRYDDYEEDDE